MPEQQSNKTFFPGLDSLRFCAFLLVFFFHSIPSFTIGYTGVLFFFVISAFLLTYLALEEINKKGSFNPVHFFVRRALRIYPLYYLIVVFAFIILPLLSKVASIPITLPVHPWYYWLFLSNYDYSDHVFFLKFLWSIAVEEQFYIGFALLALFFKKGFWLIWGSSLVIYIVVLLLNYSGKVELGYYNTVTYLPCFLTGMLLAKTSYASPSASLKVSLILLILAIAIYLSIMTFPLMEIFLNCQIALFFGSLIGFVIYIFRTKDSSISKWLAPTEYLGKLTYGLYVYSGLVFTLNIVVLKIKEPILKQATEFGLILLLAYLSYRFYEKPFLRLKKKWR